jgi:hypothetical protein
MTVERLVAEIDGCSTTWAAWFTHLAASRISPLRRGNLDRVSLKRLVEALSFLGFCVDVVVAKPNSFRGD